MLAESLKQQLKTVASAAIQYGLTHRQHMPIDLTDYPAELTEKRASFVTLQLNGQLRGCIGSLEAYQPLVKDIAHNAYAAAFSDPRFSPLTAAEFAQIDIHLSILSKPQPLPCNSEADLLAKLRPGIDGLIIEASGQRATFLPSVWESLSSPNDFVHHLKLKAGLPVNYWSDDMQCFIYTTESF